MLCRIRRFSSIPVNSPSKNGSGRNGARTSKKQASRLHPTYKVRQTPAGSSHRPANRPWWANSHGVHADGSGANPNRHTDSPAATSTVIAAIGGDRRERHPSADGGELASRRQHARTDIVEVAVPK